MAARWRMLKVRVSSRVTRVALAHTTGLGNMPCAANPARGITFECQAAPFEMLAIKQ
jgi:hypothetical protein